ncbi:hypothetical protein Plec18170_005343 [Paecilomyces lecythidis]
MPKRKRAESEDAHDSPESREERRTVLRVTRLTNKFDYEIQTLFRALKTARGVERQKMGRRQKTAQKEKNEGALARLQEEVQVLKTLDLEITAQKYLFKQLAKTKRIAESPAFIRFKEAKQLSLEGPKSNAESNVIARLFKSTPIKNVMPGIMDGFRALLGVDAAPSAKSTKDSKEKDREQKTEAKAPKSRADGQWNEESEKSSDEEAGADDVSMADIQSDDFAQFDSRLAASSDESESEGASGDDGDGDISMDDSKKNHYDHAADLSLSPTPSDSESESPSATSVKASKKASATTKGTVKDTTFLPSLMMGGYWSGSESGDEPAADEPPRRKNRMGQQARRALWEKKYGSGANHVRKEQEKKKNSRDSGWDVRKGAMDPDADGRKKFGKGRSGPGAGRPAHRTGDRGASSYHNGRSSFQEKKPQDDKPLHPSWEAKKRAKEQAAQVSFQGKKITFD